MYFKVYSVYTLYYYTVECRVQLFEYCVGFEYCVKLDHSIFYATLFLIQLYFELLVVMTISEDLLKSKLTVALDASYVVSSI